MAKKNSRKKEKNKIEIKRKKIEQIPNDKADGMMALMSAVLVILISILNTKVSSITAVILMILFAAYKLLK